MILSDEPEARNEMFSMLSSAATWERGDSFQGSYQGYPIWCPVWYLRGHGTATM